MVFIVESKPLNPAIHSFNDSFNKWLMEHLLCVRHTEDEEAAPSLEDLTVQCWREMRDRL